MSMDKGITCGTLDKAQLQVCRIATGTYTGDGTLSNPITGVGFRPKFVIILQDPDTDANADIWATIDVVSAGNAWSVAGGAMRNDRITSLDDDGFTVDDEGIDSHPNRDGDTYRYVAWG